MHSGYYPIVIECIPTDELHRNKHSHITLAYLDKFQTTINPSNPNTESIQLASPISNKTELTTLQDRADKNLGTKALSVGCISQIVSNYQIKAIKQKQYIDGIVFSLQEIYGIEKKLTDENTTPSMSNESQDTISTSSDVKPNDQEQELKGVECVICMCEIRDTLILPCRHLCLCKLCAYNLRVQSNNCPICRIPFIALIQIKLYRKKNITENPVSESLPVLTLKDLNNTKDSTVIFQIDNKIVETEVKDFHVKCENSMPKNNKNRRKKLSELYEKVNLFDIFKSDDDLMTKKNKIKTSKKDQIKNQVEEIVLSCLNECDSKRQEQTKNATEIDLNNLLNAMNSTNSKDSKKSMSVNVGSDKRVFNSQNNKISRSYVDLKISENLIHKATSSSNSIPSHNSQTETQMNKCTSKM